MGIGSVKRLVSLSMTSIQPISNLSTILLQCPLLTLYLLGWYARWEDDGSEAITRTCSDDCYEYNAPWVTLLRAPSHGITSLLRPHWLFINRVFYVSPCHSSPSFLQRDMCTRSQPIHRARLTPLPEVIRVAPGITDPFHSITITRNIIKP